MSFTPVKHNTSSSELLQTDHCEQSGSVQHLSASSHTNYNLQVDNKSQPIFSTSNSPAKKVRHQQADNSIIKPPDQFRSGNEDQPTMHG